jgi:thiamine pyrophosphokinase
MRPARSQRALVVADGDVASSSQLPADLLAAPDGARPLVIAADGGLAKATALGLAVDAVVGDLDSVGPAELEEAARAGIEIVRHPTAKDESDTELAVREAISRGATEVLILGGLGSGRFDHALANVLLAANPDIGAQLILADGPTSLRVLGRHGAEQLALEGAIGDIVSLLPLSEQVEGVTTGGLAFPLANAVLAQGPSLGLSNELVATHATVAVGAGRLAVIHTRQEKQ